MQIFLKKYRIKLDLSPTSAVALSMPAVLALAGCGSKSEPTNKGFPISYTPPTPNYNPPNVSDPYSGILNLAYVNPYWVQALEMDHPESHILPILEKHERVIQYNFSDTQPDYYQSSITGWVPASEEMKSATREILLKFEEILDVKFSETNDPKATNVIVTGRSEQKTTSGFSYFPNNFYEIGMDVFIAKGYANPRFSSENTTNYDYEVLLHEIGHALGLKHPFEASGANNATLSTYEDNTYNTAMSYTDSSETFNGTLRPLDWMTLTKFYGVKSTYKAADDTYKFSNLNGTFILDGAGVDTISAYNASQDVTIDLRPGSHSHLGSKSTYITDANQLTISHGSDIENVITGSGDDTVVGTNLDNVILTGSGSDTIFAGGGTDIIRSGAGSDKIDVSESEQSRDTITLDTSITSVSGIDTIYGFAQGALGDILDVSAIISSAFELFPLVSSGFAPTANFSNGILRLTGSNTSTATHLSGEFKVGGGFETLSLDDSAKALIISSDSQSTGEDQCVFSAESKGGEISITQLALLQGNTLDIDQWHSDNFGIFV